MDFFSKKARDLRRTKRLSTFNKLADAFRPKPRGRDLTTQNAGLQAVALVRETLNNYRLPGMPRLGFSGIRQARLSDGSFVDSGVITIHAEFKTFSGVNVGLDIPVQAVDGKLLDPSVLIHDGQIRVMAQSTFDEIVQRNTAHDEIEVRGIYSPPLDKPMAEKLYSDRKRIDRSSPGMFSVLGARNLIRKALKLGADLPMADPRDVTPVCTHNLCPGCGGCPSWQLHDPGDVFEKTDPMCPRCRGFGLSAPSQVNLPEFTADKKEDWVYNKPLERAPQPSSERSQELVKKQHPDRRPWERNQDPKVCEHRDPAERMEEIKLHPGDVVSVSNDLVVKERGGVSWEIPNGAKAEILKDVAGDGKVFHVRFEEGPEALVDVFHLSAQKSAPKKITPKRLSQPGIKGPKAKPSVGRLCKKCQHAPCVCLGKKKAQEDDLPPFACKDCGAELTGEERMFMAPLCRICHEGKYPKGEYEESSVGPLKITPGAPPFSMPPAFASRQASMDEIVAKVQQELEQMSTEGIDEVDRRQAVMSKYGEEVLHQTRNRL